MSGGGAVARPSEFDYDVCLSFAGEQRDYVEAVARALDRHGVRYFYDRDQETDMWGKDLYTHLDEIYRKRSRFCVVFGSADYVRKEWTNHERISAQARAMQQLTEYVLPVLFDDTEIPGLRNSIGHLTADRFTPEQLAQKIAEKINSAVERTTTNESPLGIDGEKKAPDGTADGGSVLDPHGLPLQAWRYRGTADDAPALRNITNRAMPGSRGGAEETPFVRIGAAVACDPLPEDASSSVLGARLLEFLDTHPIRLLVDTAPSVADDMGWKRLAGNGIRWQEAVFGQSDGLPYPTASAMFLAPNVDTYHGNAGEVACLWIQINWHTTAGTVGAPAGLGPWYEVFCRVIALVSDLAEFLTSRLGLATRSEPAACAGLLLQAPQSLHQIVDRGHLRQLEGQVDPRQFIAYAIADPAGRNGEQVARLMMKRLSDQLHLDDFDDAIDSLHPPASSPVSQAPDAATAAEDNRF